MGGVPVQFLSSNCKIESTSSFSGKISTFFCEICSASTKTTYSYSYCLFGGPTGLRLQYACHTLYIDVFRCVLLIVAGHVEGLPAEQQSSRGHSDGDRDAVHPGRGLQRGSGRGIVYYFIPCAAAEGLTVKINTITLD
eukprot:scaffold290777_cov26-Prasinocladus_malaysianus.AAC.1